MDALDKKHIDICNRFYLQISRKVLSDNEYDIAYKLLVEKQTKSSVAKEYNFSYERVRQIYIDTTCKAKSVMELLNEIDSIKLKRDQLRQKFYEEYKFLHPTTTHGESEILSKKIADSYFPFSYRLKNLLDSIGYKTIGDLVATPLVDFMKYRGFKTVCKKEFIEFIEFENIEDFFDGFFEWKNTYLT